MGFRIRSHCFTRLGLERNEVFATLPNFNQLDDSGFRVSAGGAAIGFSAASPGSGGITAPLPTPAAHVTRDLPEIETLNVELCKDNQGEG
jgi:hypothetical protein